ncbi:MAG: hypothetical protein RIB57_01270 [Pelagibacterium sp.]|uniref:hypothetical protein n=1 Tax=Pelagibacterium sp. TaxID=1967288 RepID=UPI0032EF1B1E
MALPDTFPGVKDQPLGGTGVKRGADSGKAAFLEALAGVLVDPPVHHGFAGAIERETAGKIWTWMARDIAGDEAARLADAVDSGADAAAAFDLLLPEILERLKANAAAEKDDRELERRNSIQMGGEEARQRLAPVIMAMRRRPLLVQAGKFGVAVGSISDEAALVTALQSISITNPLTRALWMQAMVGHMANPSRVMAAAVAIAGGNTETRITNAGYGALVEAVLSHAQSQIGRLASQPNLFSDIDFSCKAIDRFHRLMRSINYNLEIERRSLWGTIMTDLTARLSERLERPMKEITINVTQALRRPRDGNDKVDPDQVLAALNGLYLLIAVRKSRDSLAVNALLDQAWADTGQAVEVLVGRALDMYRAQPADPAARERLDAGIKMAEIRFNPEYADILRRARDGAERRTAQG